MTTHPTATELMRAVAQWIDEVRPQLSQRDAYLARVAMNALAIVEREWQQRANGEAATTSTLQDLLGEPGDYDTLMHELCEALRSGKMTAYTPGVLALLRQDTAAKLAIDQPTYRHDASE